MRYLCFFTLIFSFLLNGCFSGKEYPSGLLNSSELQKKREVQRMKEWEHNKTLRIGIAGANRKIPDNIRKKLESDGWKLNEIVCPEKRMTGLLRSGAVDLIYRSGMTKEDADRWNLIYLSPGLLGNNQYLLIQEQKSGFLP